MFKKYLKGIVYAFIDSQNLNLGVRSQGWKLDFARFRVLLKDKFAVTKAYIFIGHVAGNESLYAYLKASGYILIFKPTIERHKGKKILTKGNVDAELVLHCMIQYKNYNKAIIVSGDGDFRCLIEYLVNKKKLLKIVVPNEHGFSFLLREFRNYVVFVRSFKKKVQLIKKKRGNNLRTKP